MRPRPSRIVLALLAALATTGASADAPVEIAPHRAIFEVSLAGPSDLLESARGLALVELKRACDGWRYRQRYELETVPFSGEPNRMSFTVDGQESLDHRTYAFHSSTNYGIGEPILLIGRAETDPNGGVVRFTEPVKAERPLPPGTGFVVGSIKHALREAAAGAQKVTAHWFAGTSPDEPLLVSSIVLPAEPDPAAPPLLVGQRWRFASAFFDAKDETIPLYEGEETILANGVLAGAVYHYDGYSLRLALQRLESIPLPAC